MNTSRITLLMAACFGMTLACCTAPEEPMDPGTGEHSQLKGLLLGQWDEIPPGDVIRFAGSNLAFDFRADSLRILHHQFTDAAGCVTGADSTRQCSDFQWINIYEGAWSIVDSSLRVEFRFVRTTASPLTSNLPHPGGSAAFTVSLEGNRLALRQTGGQFISLLPEIRLARPERPLQRASAGSPGPQSAADE